MPTRKRPAAPSTSKSTTSPTPGPTQKSQKQQQPTPRQSALAKEHGISASTESEIKEAFCLFANPASTTSGELPSSSLRRALTALGVAPASSAELRDLLEAADPEDEGVIAYRHFVAVAALKLNSRSEESQAKEVEEAFGLFTKMGGHSSAGGGGERGEGGEERITIGCLRRVAKELKEDVSDEVLKSMILEANGGSGVSRGANLREFEGVMRRAGVFR